MTNGHLTDKRYPHCSRLGILRRTSKHLDLCISTTALYEVVGWKKYQTFLPYMMHGARNGQVLPGSCERWLKETNA